MNGENLIYKKEGALAHIIINREKALNALNHDLMMRLDQIFSELEQDDQVIVVVITGAGNKAFVAGADVKEIKEAGNKRTELIGNGQEIFSRIRNSSQVVIAAVNGFALGGGCELALACDIRIASENAKFGFPEVKLGLMPGYGGTQLLPRLIGVGGAKYVIFTGEMLTATEAFQFGLVEKVCPPDRLMEEANTLARKIAANGPFAVRACKRAINRGVGIPLDAALKLELEEYDKAAHSKDAEEGIAAFLEKRTPTFKGR
ncbi:MAG TPA: enoyl-CoA hydratase-related protein [Thermodesulfobacteriota bacterium]|nr:enoyl-CoA hydratase-related protein [Thermodesulfobacteriota bacterium]